MPSVTYEGLAGQTVFPVPFAVNSVLEATVTVNGTPAVFTPFGNHITLTAPVATTGHDVVITGFGSLAGEVDTALAGKGLAASGKTPVAHDFATAAPTSQTFRPLTGRTAYLELTGAGSCVLQLEYECADGITFAPRAVATDGSSAIILGRISYSGSPLVLSFETTVAAQVVRARAIGTVTSAVKGTFRQ